MSDLGSDLLKRYGGAAVILAVILALAIWALAHFASAPGTQVKILWGLVEYTTPSSSIAKVPTVASADPEPANAQPSPGLVKLEVSHGLTSDGYFKMIKALRSRHVLRELRPIESDRPIEKTPPGTYFFVLGPWLVKSPDSMRSENLLDNRTSRLQSSSWSYFEVHHRSTGQFLLLAFLSELDGDRVRTLTGDREFQVIIAPRPWGTFSTLVELPFERIVASKKRSLEIEETKHLVVLDATVR